MITQRREKINDVPARSYPLRCIDCGKKEVHPAVVPQEIKKNHDGKVYDLTINDLPVTKCASCGAIAYTIESDERITSALREHLGLLAPEQMRENLDAL